MRNSVICHCGPKVNRYNKSCTSLPVKLDAGCKSMLHPFLHFNEPWNIVYQTQQVSKNAAISHFHRCPQLDVVSVICVVEAHTGLHFPLFFLKLFFVPPLLLEWGCWWWVQFLIHIGSGRWIRSSCSPSLFHFKPSASVPTHSVAVRLF